MKPGSTPARKLRRLQKLSTPHRLKRPSSPSGSNESSEPEPVTPVGVPMQTLADAERREANLPREVTMYTPPLVDKSLLLQFCAGANQNFNDVINLTALAPDLQRRVIMKAPFILGLKDAVYDKNWYREAARLCATGPHRSDITEKMLPRSKWAGKWGADGQGDPTSEIWLRDAEDDTTREWYESLYARVYGNKPDNGGLAKFFLRAVTYYLEEKKPVDWAALALELHEKRFSNPLLNPQNLTPPCLTKQVQGMVDEFADALAKLHVHAPSPMKNLGPSYLDEFKLKLQSKEEDEAACKDQISVLKKTLATEEKALVAAVKAHRHHSADLELMFKGKQEAELRGDREFVAFAFGQINAIAKSVANGAKACKNQQEQVESLKANLGFAEKAQLLQVESAVRDAKCKLQDALTEVGMFPQHALPKLPAKPGAMGSVCPYCSRIYVANAFVLLSCGCHYHPPCMRSLILSGQVNCLACGARPHGTWMAYWGFSLDPTMSKELEEHIAKGLVMKTGWRYPLL